MRGLPAPYADPARIHPRECMRHKEGRFSVWQLLMSDQKP